LRIIAAQRRRADSIKAPTPGAEMPPSLEIGDVLVWGRDALFASGALTLGDLLERVPGLTVFRTGWLGSPEQGAYIADVGRLRIFSDGMELPALDQRNGGTIDLSFVQLWPLEEVRVERGASEVRVHLRSWRVRSTTPATRVDVGTGDAETNGYRGYFGRRFGSGQALQVGAFQFTTRDTPGVGDADQLSLFGRAGWARGRFAFDVTYLRTKRERTVQPRLRASGRPDLPNLNATNGDLYVRAAYMDAARGLWGQLTAGQLKHDHSRQLGTDEASADATTDSTAFSARQRQYVAAAGWLRGALSLSATTRLFEGDSARDFVTALRGSWETRRIAIGALAEDRPDRAARAFEVQGRVLPLPSLAIAGAVAKTLADGGSRIPSSLAFRGEAGLRLGRVWLGGGLLSRDTAHIIAPVVFDTGFAGRRVGAATGVFAFLRGKVWKDVGVDLMGTKWDSAGAYTPKYQTRSRLYFDSDMRGRYPSGNLGILFVLQHEYRSPALFLLRPVGATTPQPLRSSEFRSYGLLLEIRLLQATLSYQYRNMINAPYEQVPGFRNMSAVQYYGVRWNFYN
jgi:hypothetical protein